MWKFNREVLYTSNSRELFRHANLLWTATSWSVRSLTESSNSSEYARISHSTTSCHKCQSRMRRLFKSKNLFFTQIEARLRFLLVIVAEIDFCLSQSWEVIRWCFLRASVLVLQTSVGYRISHRFSAYPSHVGLIILRQYILQNQMTIFCLRTIEFIPNYGVCQRYSSYFWDDIRTECFNRSLPLLSPDFDIFCWVKPVASSYCL